MRGPTPWVIAIMSFSCMIVAASRPRPGQRREHAREGDPGALFGPDPGGGADVSALLKAVQAAPGRLQRQAVPERKCAARSNAGSARPRKAPSCRCLRS